MNPRDALHRIAASQGLHGGAVCGPALLILLLSAACVLAGCQDGLGRRGATGQPPASSSGGPDWFERVEGMRFEAAVLVRNGFAKIPLTALVSVDASGRLTFVGLSEMGFRLAEASVSSGDRPPARLHPLLARVPGLAVRLPLALERVFLVWPQTPDMGAPQREGYPAGATDPEQGVRYTWQTATERLTGKKGYGGGGDWSVSMRYAPDAAPKAAPVEIAYRGEGVSIIFKLKDVSGDE